MGSPKSTQNDDRFPSIGFRSIPCSSSYRKSCLISFGQLQRYPEKPDSSLQEHQFQHRNSRNAPCIPYCLEKRADSQDSIEDVGQHSTSNSRGAFPQQKDVRGTRSLLPQVEWIPRCPDSKEGRISLQWLECRLVFHLTR